MLEKMELLDQQLFLFLNQFHTPWLDTLMYLITVKYTWFPFYLVLIVWLIWRYKWQGLVMLVTMVATIGLGDLITSGLMKPYFGRLRPCHDPDIMHMVHLVKGCGGRFGFASAHAATTFALATTLWCLLKHWSHRWGLAFVWAGFIAYSRVYLGVHYPADVVAGAIIGVVSGYLIVQLMLRVTKQWCGTPISTKYLE